MNSSVANCLCLTYKKHIKNELSYSTHWVGWALMAQGADLAARLIIKYENDNPLHVETQKDFDVVCNRDIDAF
ncbi:MAG TPA: hypothetical protein VEH06_14455, partial [Candidatus Bathyarchaeia archaeon]|nr:hypothetical protein [Candidatus Bathyarchaeia archaeon]